MRGNLEYLKERLEYAYRSSKRSMLKRETKWLATPTEELRSEIDQMKGELKGLKKALNLVEARMAGAELPLYEIEGDGGLAPLPQVPVLEGA